MESKMHLLQTTLLRATMSAALILPAISSAQGIVEVPMPSGVNFFGVDPAQSAAPYQFGWPLPVEDDGVWSAVDVGGTSHTLNISDLFPNGIALGSAAQWFHDRDGNTNMAGPRLHVHLAGLVTLGAPLSRTRQDADSVPGQPADMPMGVDWHRARALNDMANPPEAAEGSNEVVPAELASLPDILAPRWQEAADADAAAACDDPDALANARHRVFVYATALDDEANQAGTHRLVVTWQKMLPHGAGAIDCAEQTNTTQLIITQLPLPPGVSGRNPAEVEYRFGNCGWSSAWQGAAPQGQNIVGGRSGLIVSRLVPGMPGQPEQVERVAVELLGESVPGIGAIQDGVRPASGSARAEDGEQLCQQTNVEWVRDEDGALILDGRGRPVPVMPGRFVVQFDQQTGLPFEDGDLDGVSDDLDNCPNNPNPFQRNLDDDGSGDACDDDSDSDDIRVGDNCPLNNNNSQSDLDGDGKGDVCDEDIDGDDILNEDDVCPRLAIPAEQLVDTDGDGRPDRCDIDDDNDGWVDPLWYVWAVATGQEPPQRPENPPELDPPPPGTGPHDLKYFDNCPRVYNPQQWDINKNGIGDHCESDFDETIWGELQRPPYQLFHARKAYLGLKKTEIRLLALFIQLRFTSPVEEIESLLRELVKEWRTTGKTLGEYLEAEWYAFKARSKTYK